MRIRNISGRLLPITDLGVTLGTDPTNDTAEVNTLLANQSAEFEALVCANLVIIVRSYTAPNKPGSFDDVVEDVKGHQESYGDPVQDLTELSAVGPGDRIDKQVRLVEDEGSMYRFDADATVGGTAPDTGTGFWFVASAPIPAHNALTGIDGGSAPTEAYHLTMTQHTGLTGGGTTALHSHVPGDHNDLGTIQGGSATERFHLTSAEHTGLTSGGATALHSHSTSHGGLSGLAGDDHPQYSLADGSRAFTGTVEGVTPTSDPQLATKGYTDSAITSAVITSHGSLADLSADDHTQYLLADGSRSLSGELNQATSTFAVADDMQARLFTMTAITTSGAAVELFRDGSSSRIVLPSESTFGFEATVLARGVSGTNDGSSAIYRYVGAIKNNGGTTSVVGTISKSVVAEDIAGWDSSVVADDTNDSIMITGTGDATTTVYWAAKVETTEIVG